MARVSFSIEFFRALRGIRFRSRFRFTVKARITVELLFWVGSGLG